MKIIFASHNVGKIKEMRAMLADIGVTVLGAEEAGVHEEAVEDGATFEANALKKAYFVAERTGQWAVADDSGICIAALGGRPGVYSKRWAGEGAHDSRIVEYTLEQAKNIPEGERDAWFESAVALTAPDGRHWVFSGQVRGRLAVAPRGSSLPGLPYDVIFIPEGHEVTFGEMRFEEKNALSHRGRAFAQLKEFLKKLLSENQLQ